MSSMPPFPLIELSGGPEDRGESYGRQAAERVKISRVIGNQKVGGSKLPTAMPIRSGVRPMVHSTFDPQVGQK